MRMPAADLDRAWVARTLALLFAAGVGLLAVVTLLAFTTTDLHGCDNGCSGYERALLEIWRPLALATTASGAAAALLWLAGRRERR
jgi:hypothetical protein